MNVKRRIVGITILFLVLIIVSTIVVWIVDSVSRKQVNESDIVVEINAIEHQISNGETDKAIENLDNLTIDVKADSHGIQKLYLIPLGLAVIYVLVIFTYIYKSILKPFEKLHDFAAQVAAGDLDIPLKQERGLYFGEFTWAFDNMRREIKKARDSEKEAIENNKTVIATLSHDIKTPISSIRSYSEALEANLDKTPEKRSKYLNTIINKCDEVAKLTDDLFIHSVSDMGKMSVNCVKINLNQFIKSIHDSLNTFNNVNVHLPDEDVSVNADPERLMQICENIVGNTNKYAPGRIDISITSTNGKTNLVIRDYGSGIPEENLPFITQKFYRGNNVEGIQGSGLGLYIVSYLSSRMNAELSIDNIYEGDKCQGLSITISFDIVD